jgi:hypothetical protein
MHFAYPVHWLLVAVMAFLVPFLTQRTEKPGEFYPFSNFPMYSKFEAATYYVYLTDQRNAIVPVGPLFGRSISDLKKVYDRKIGLHKQPGKRRTDVPLPLRERSAQETLAWLVENAPTTHRDKITAIGPLVLRQVDITYRDGRIHKAETVITTYQP